MSFGLGIKGALGGAAQGASIGSAIPGLGTAAGGAIGGGLGLLSGTIVTGKQHKATKRADGQSLGIRKGRYGNAIPIRADGCKRSTKKKPRNVELN